MQSLVLCGRLLSRALTHGISSSGETSAAARLKRLNSNSAASTVDSEIGPVASVGGYARLLTVWSGFPKDLSHQFSPAKGQFGDDACFVAGHSNTDVLGVADGVGGWRQYGVDPSLFSLSLMQSCERLAFAGAYDPNSPAATILSKAYFELLENKEPIIGSTTACVVVLNRISRVLHTANIGDSGFLVMRQGKVVLRSEEQQHYFNTPFQLSVAPARQHGQVLNDGPESADTSSFPVADGDLILLGTDGLFDNVPDSVIVHQLAELQSNVQVNEANMQKTANTLALLARRLAFDDTYVSPFARRARENGIRATGGKPDDITVLLASVTIQ